jgi:cytochrome c
MRPSRRRLAALAAAILPLGAAAGAEPSAGARLFQLCYACHSLDPAEMNLPGPHLAGIVGRRAGTVPGFEYSEAARAAAAAGLVWDEAALDAFLADPAAALPGTAMAFPGLKGAAERATLIAFLRTDPHSR